MKGLDDQIKNIRTEYPYNEVDLWNAFEVGRSCLLVGGRYHEIGTSLLRKAEKNTADDNLKRSCYQQLDVFGERLYYNDYAYLKNHLTYNNLSSIYPNIKTNFSQSMQDIFVASALDRFSGRRPTYLEFGSSNPVINSNTFLLESELNFYGIGFEFDLAPYIEYRRCRKNPIIYGNVLNYNFYELLPEYGFKFDEFIDYVQMDIDPTETTFLLLQNFLNSTYKAGIITYEHNLYADGNQFKNEARRLLEDNNYELIIENVAPCVGMPFEDWYIHKDYHTQWTKRLIGRDYVVSTDIFEGE